MRQRLLAALVPLLGIALFAAAIAALHRELGGYHWGDVLEHVRAIPASRSAAALALTALSYAALTGYDALGFRWLGRSFAYRRIAFASFIAYVFSHNVGLSWLGGSAVRYRLFSAWGLLPAEIARLIAFTVLTFWVGFLGLTGALLTLHPIVVPAGLPLAGTSSRPLGFAMLSLVGLYLAASGLRAPRVLGVQLPMPGFRFAIGQLALSALDWTIAGSVLFALLPGEPDLSFPAFLAIFLVAQIAGAISHVPAGLGVFETIMVVLLRGTMPADQVLGAAVAYRVVYYLLPLCVAVAMLGGYEALQRRAVLTGVGRVFGRFSAQIVPRALAVATFVAGAIELVTGAIPPPARRFDWLGAWLPLSLIEVSHFLGSLVGMGLLLLARGLQRRTDAAYYLALSLLGSGALLALAKGLHFEEAAALALVFLALLPCRRFFYRRAALLTGRLSAAWLLAIGVVLVGNVFLVLLAYKNVAYSHDLWWQFELDAHVSRSLRVGVGALVAIVTYSAARLLRPGSPPVAPASEPELVRARAVVSESTTTTAWLALLGDKSLLWNDSRSAFVMYGVEGQSFVSMGDPVGPETEFEELVWRFHELADRHGAWTVFYQVGPRHLPLYVDLGLSLHKLGEEARVPLEGFGLEGGRRRALRQARNRMLRVGCEFELVPVEKAPELMDELQRVSDAWLAKKATREKRFSLGSFQRSYLSLCPIAVVRHEGRVQAFANVLTSGARQELSVDLMRALPQAPSGVMEFLFTELMLWGAPAGYRWFNVGMAPLAGMERRRLAPLWAQVGSLVYRHGETFYGFRGLRAFKEKFEPVWEPRFVASPGGLAFPGALANVAALISGGVKGVVRK